MMRFSSSFSPCPGKAQLRGIHVFRSGFERGMEADSASHRLTAWVSSGCCSEIFVWRAMRLHVHAYTLHSLSCASSTAVFQRIHIHVGRLFRIRAVRNGTCRSGSQRCDHGVKPHFIASEPFWKCRSAWRGGAPTTLSQPKLVCWPIPPPVSAGLLRSGCPVMLSKGSIIVIGPPARQTG